MPLMIRKSSVYLVTIAALCLFMAGLFLIHPRLHKGDNEKKLADCKLLVRKLQLTDLCLFTEARYTRHLSQADLHSPFQDFPMALEHFPSGSMVMPPQHLLQNK
ncbi:MAG: hypothetical protein KKD01_10865 [Proteobacteria bacterium]|nr:hypothetical protein [Pseudomonadota bacterium]MBU1420178.1 hypothetical protein [Pseudomonadota bacterium]MBU1455216.1 hypothetical protein [Pseudomonadota bacterium]